MGKQFKMRVKLFLILCVAGLVFYGWFSLGKGINISSLKLEQVLILSRHNIRTPLSSGLKQYSAKIWPKWYVGAGLLTEKGAKLEGYMGKYIAEWLADEDFFEGCPKKDKVLIYASRKSRTIASAKAFTESAFQFCDITVRHKKVSVSDPTFLAIFHNTEETFKKEMKEVMSRQLRETNLTQAYLELNRILDIGNADICKKLFICNLANRTSKIVIKDGKQPDVNGPLFIGNLIVDWFLMSYYEGIPHEQIAWGEIATDYQWRTLTQISKAYLNIRFNSGASDIAGPLLKYMFDIFNNGKPKFTLLMGHNSNLNSVITALDFKSFNLPNQYEPFPIGGKIIFQKWSNDTNKYLKTEYVYARSLQLRNGDKLSLHNPPEKVLLELKDCKTDSDGFCLWSDFMRLNTYS